MDRLQSIVHELRRRHVFRVAGIYIVAAWVLVQVADTAFPGIGVPEAAIRFVWLAAILGFPLALVFGWRYDITPQGIVRTPPSGTGTRADLTLHRTDFVILSLLAVVAIGVIYQLTVQISSSRSGMPVEPVQPGFDSHSIAVLPLDNLSNNPEQEFFVAGMHEALIADLARISSLKVISRLSTEQYRGSSKVAAEIGAELGVAYLIEGSVMRADDRVRISVQLINTSDNTHVWGESYQRKLSNVLDLQSNLARAIAHQVKTRLTPHENEQLSVSRVVDPEAYELYLRGRFHWYRFSEADLKLALEYFQESIDKDPGYALAYVGFADALATPAHAGMMPTTQVFPAARAFVERALELDPDLAEAHDLLARINFAYYWDWDAAERGFRRAISLKPGYPDVHVVYSQYLAIMNRRDEALEEARIGASLDPLNPWFQLEYAQRRAWYEDYDAAYSEIRALITRHPDTGTLYQYLWDLAYIENEFKVAINAAARYFELQGESGVAALLTAVDSEDAYREILLKAAEELEENALRPYVSKVNLARVRMHAGDHARAQDYLDQALSLHESQLGYTTTNPLFRPLWNTDRFRKLRRAINL
jgi:TolB-like protein